MKTTLKIALTLAGVVVLSKVVPKNKKRACEIVVTPDGIKMGANTITASSIKSAISNLRPENSI